MCLCGLQLQVIRRGVSGLMVEGLESKVLVRFWVLGLGFRVLG